MFRKSLFALLMVAGLFVGLIPTAMPVSAASCGMHIYILNHNNLTLDVSLVGGGGNLDWGDGTGAYFGEGTGQKIYHGYSYNVGGTTSYTITLTPDGGGSSCQLTITIDDNNVPTFCNLYGVEVGFNALTVGADVQVGNAQSARLDWGDGSYVDLGNGSGQHQWHSYSYNSQGQDVYTITLNIPHAPACTRTFTIDGPSQQGWLSGGDAVSSYYPCPLGIGPGGITPGNYDSGSLTQEQRQYLFQAFGNSGTASVGYGGQSCSGEQGYVTPPTPPPAPTDPPPVPTDPTPDPTEEPTPDPTEDPPSNIWCEATRITQITVAELPVYDVEIYFTTHDMNIPDGDVGQFRVYRGTQVISEGISLWKNTVDQGGTIWVLRVSAWDTPDEWTLLYSSNTGYCYNPPEPFHQ